MFVFPVRNSRCGAKVLFFKQQTKETSRDFLAILEMAKRMNEIFIFPLCLVDEEKSHLKQPDRQIKRQPDRQPEN